MNNIKKSTPMDDFDNDIKYKLYRSLYEIIHPTISKKNISNYKIILDDKLVPVRVFYPEKVSSITSLIIFIHGNNYITNCFNSYSSICREISDNTNKLVIAIDYDSKSSYKDAYNKCFDIVNYFYNNCNKCNISEKKIILMGDSLGCNILLDITHNIETYKKILFYPILSNNHQTKAKRDSNYVDKLKMLIDNKYISDSDFCLNKNYDNITNTLIITGNVDLFRDNGKILFDKLISKKNIYYNIDFADHGFLLNNDLEIKNSIYEVVKSFLK